MIAVPSYSPSLLAGALFALAALSSAAPTNGGAPVPRPMPSATANAAIVGKVATATELDSTTVHELRRAADGLFYVDAVVNGRTVRFLIDTGASVVVLTAADAQAVGIKLEDSHYRGNAETVGGNTAIAWTTLNHVQLAGREVRQLRAAVVQKGLGVSLLGQNMLSQLGPITIEGDRVKFRRN